jgi:uncharacterized 2Fe-2S/4Fe-4S cluster protein (DUF4445 family)
VKDTIDVQLRPSGRTLQSEEGRPLLDALFDAGVEFPCGGRGRCRGCRVRAVEGGLPVTDDDARLFNPGELRDGWRLACRAVATPGLALELAQWEGPILTDDTPLEITPREGLGAAVDLGTTTLAAQLVDLRTGRVLAVKTALNAQARRGADLMSRLDFALSDCGAAELTGTIRGQVGGMIEALLDAVPNSSGALAEVVITGNTVMHHFFCGLDIRPLATHPFESRSDGGFEFSGGSLGWRGGAADARVHFLPCMGGFVGSDLLAGVLATRMHESYALNLLVDLGTNGEIVLGDRTGFLCASTAAGPAFEGARISCGMRAETGAIVEVKISDGGFVCRVAGGGRARGVCGSGILDAAACGLDLGRIRPNGRLASGVTLPLEGSIALTQGDLRELQLAKGAIAAGIRLLLNRRGASPEDVVKVWLAGAFGNYLNRSSAVRTGLLEFPADKISPAGNTSLLGAKLALFHGSAGDSQLEAARRRTRHVDLNLDPGFLDAFADAMSFPESNQP